MNMSGVLLFYACSKIQAIPHSTGAQLCNPGLENRYRLSDFWPRVFFCFRVSSISPCPVELNTSEILVYGSMKSLPLRKKTANEILTEIALATGIFTDVPLYYGIYAYLLYRS